MGVEIIEFQYVFDGCEIKSNSTLMSMIHNLCHQKSFSAQEMASKLARMQNQLKSLTKKTPETLEEFIFLSTKSVHVDHLAVVEAKYMTAMMYGNIKGFQYKG